MVSALTDRDTHREIVRPAALLRMLLIVALALTLVAPALATSPLMTPAHPAAAQGNWTEPALPVAAFGEHPRLLISRTYINETLRPRRDANTATWQAFVAYVDSDAPEADVTARPAKALRALALAWLVTENPGYAGRAKAIMVELSLRVEQHPALAEGAGYDVALMDDVAALALGYDWLYNALTADDRAGIRLTLWRAAKRIRDPAADTDGLVFFDGQMHAFNHEHARWLWALTAAGLALWGENEAAPDLLAFCREVLTEITIPALDIQSGGAWSEGPVYGFLATWSHVQTALAWWTAAGENYFDATDWWYDRLAYDMFLRHPAAAMTYNDAERGDPIHSYPSIIGDSQRYHTAAAIGRAADALLRAVFPNTEHGNWMAWFLRQPPDAMPGWMAADAFLWRDPDWPGVPPFTTTWVAPYLGHVFMRSNWTTPDGTLDPSATYVSFNAGDHLSAHQFFDQGNLTIFHNGADLLVRSGVYSGKDGSDHAANWYARSIAANTLLICDLAEDFDGIRPNVERDAWVNDCGQRALHPAPRSAINVDHLIANWRPYDTGSITRIGDLGSATYIRADLTGAYNSTVYTTPENSAKVSTVVRELVYLRPGLVIVSDRVQTTYPSYTPQAVFHFQNDPAPSGIFYGSLVSESALYMQNLLPDSQVTEISGFQVAGMIVNQAWGEAVTNAFERSPYGFFRLEITPGRPDLNNWFLTAFLAQDADQPPPPAGTLVLGDTLRGVALDLQQVMFDKLPDDGADVTSSVFQVAPGVEVVLVTGLAPETAYRVIGEGGFDVTRTADAAGMLLLTDVLPGALRLATE